MSDPVPAWLCGGVVAGECREAVDRVRVVARTISSRERILVRVSPSVAALMREEAVKYLRLDVLDPCPDVSRYRLELNGEEVVVDESLRASWRVEVVGAEDDLWEDRTYA